MKLFCLIIPYIILQGVANGHITEDPGQGDFHRRLTLQAENNCTEHDGKASLCCDGDDACVDTGANFGATSGLAIVGESSCVGYGACNEAAIGGYFKVGQGSCIDDFSCRQSGLKGYFVAGNNSCVGDDSCNGSGKDSHHVTVGSGSCRGYQACYNQKGNTIVGDESCNAVYACFWDGVGNRTVGIGSCNNVSDVCSCLQVGDIVPDNACNSFGTDQCCVDSSTRGSMYLGPPVSATSTNTTTNITIATLTPILDLNEYNISDPTCEGSITSSFEESVTCSMTKFSGTNVSLEFLDGSCTGSTIGNITENVKNSTITGTILPDFNITGAGNETYSFCLVAKSLFASEVITEVKTLGTVTYYYTASGNFTLNVTTEALTVGEVLADATAEEVTLEAYQCLDDGSVDLNTPVAYQQGSTLSVCLHSNQPSLVLLTGVDMVISPFSSGFSPSLVVDDDVPVKSALTLVTPLLDQTIIQIKTVLISVFFLDAQNKILVQGSARFIYKTRKERILRIMQSTNDVGSSTFDLVVDLEPNESGIFDVSSSSTSNFWSILIMSFLPLSSLLL